MLFDVFVSVNHAYFDCDDWCWTEILYVIHSDYGVTLDHVKRIRAAWAYCPGVGPSDIDVTPAGFYPDDDDNSGPVGPMLL